MVREYTAQRIASSLLWLARAANEAAAAATGSEADAHPLADTSEAAAAASSEYVPEWLSHPLAPPEPAIETKPSDRMPWEDYPDAATQPALADLPPLPPGYMLDAPLVSKDAAGEP